MSNEIDNIREAQENEYCFPYHYASRFHPHFATGFFDRWAMNYNLSIEFVLQIIADENPNSLIDIGCGDGRLTSEIFKAYPSIALKGVDYSKQAIKLAKAMETSVNFEARDITLDTLENKQYSMGVLMEVFEHISLNETENFAKSVANLINDNGLLLVTVPHQNKPLEYKHFQHFTVDKLNQYFTPYFSVEKTIYIEKRGLLNSLLNKLVVNSLFALNNNKLLDSIYNLYKKHVFFCREEKHCARIAICYRKKASE
ncbi:methyltransferase [Aliikangiella sp. IMCC44359]|uniref:methyltransferase n=1 Tax=Aliikangiella sp. IMCC44359 TaxID=3459125 RepID=UPI00403AA992